MVGEPSAWIGNSKFSVCDPNNKSSIPQLRNGWLNFADDVSTRLNNNTRFDIWGLSAQDLQKKSNCHTEQKYWT